VFGEPIGQGGPSRGRQPLTYLASCRADSTMPSLARSQNAYDRFSAEPSNYPSPSLLSYGCPFSWSRTSSVSAPTGSDIADTFVGIDYFVWAGVRRRVPSPSSTWPSRRHFFTHISSSWRWWRCPYSARCAFFAVADLSFARAGVFSSTRLKRARAILTHNGCCIFVLLAVLGVVFVCSALELAFERSAHGSNIQTTERPSGGDSDCYNRWIGDLSGHGRRPRCRVVLMLSR